MTKKIKKDETNNKILELEKQIQELKIGWQRTQADFDNYQKRIESEKLENLAYTKAEFMTKLTPVLDNFYRAFAQIKKDDQISNGFRQIQKQLEDILKEEGLEKIPANSGDKFDPNFHEAISYEENSQVKDTIIDTYESGWQFENKVLKPAKVRVSKGK
ncbi:MAG: nucleotide exchange factor GrpE [Patescibacteria group bacterium]